jgi:uncharacterized protein
MISRSFNPLQLQEKRASLFLLGPRGTGKSAILKQAFKELPNSIVVDLLKGESYQRYLPRPFLLGQEIRERLGKSTGPLAVAINEIQRIPELLNEVHSLMEDFRDRVWFFLSGSSARKLKRGGANLLAGRALSRYLFPFYVGELDLNLNRALHLGTLPRVYLEDDEMARDILKSYVSTYLREEIQQEALVRSVERFSRFLDFAGQVHGEPVNFTKLGQQIGIVGKTVREYFQILEDTLLAFELPGWSQSVKKQLLQSSKFYFFDTGVLNSLNGYLGVELKPQSFLFGRLFETFIIHQIRARNEYQQLGLRFFYWRDSKGLEVDLILARNVHEPVVAIEIKSSSSPTAIDCPGFISFREDYPKVKCFCICTTPHAYTDENILFLPWQEAILSIDQIVSS